MAVGEDLTYQDMPGVRVTKAGELIRVCVCVCACVEGCVVGGATQYNGAEEREGGEDRKWREPRGAGGGGKEGGVRGWGGCGD